MELIKKLEGLSNVHFKSRVKHVSCMSSEKSDNKQLFYNVERLDEAIDKGKKVRFHYLEYHSDKKLHKRVHHDGKVREYLISPYQLAAREGKYYLICNNDKYETITNYRVDRITDIEILDENVKPFNTLIGSNGRPQITAKRYFPKDKITFFVTNPAGRLARGLWGDPPELDVARFGNMDVSGATNSPYVTISQWTEKDPAVLWTKASALFMPVLFDPESLYIATEQ